MWRNEEDVKVSNSGQRDKVFSIYSYHDYRKLDDIN